MLKSCHRLSSSSRRRQETPATTHYADAARLHGVPTPVVHPRRLCTAAGAGSSSNGAQQSSPPASLVQQQQPGSSRAPAVEVQQPAGVVPVASAVAPLTQQQRVMRLAGLSAGDFRHPLDQQNTSVIQALPGIDFVAKNLMGPAAEQVLLLENIATSIKTGPNQLPTIHALLLEAAEILQMQPPELYVRQNPTPNAYTLAITGRAPFIVVHTSLLELLTPAELQAVLAHELGHLKCDHGLWLTVANVLAMGTVSLLPLISGAVEDALLRWLRAAELTCDRAALLVAQDPAVVIGALMKLAGGSPAFAHELSVEAFLQQARSYDEATQSSMLGWYLRNAQTRQLSHPLPVMRAREVDRWAQGPQYRGLLARNRAAAGGGAAAGGVNGVGGGGGVGGSGGGSSNGMPPPQQVPRDSLSSGGAREIPIGS